MNLIQKASEYAIRCHSGTNHLYDGMPYEVHLNHVVLAANEYIHLIPLPHRPIVLAAAWTHDVIEDCRQTYNDVKEALGEEVAEIVYALTTEKGKNRKQRASWRYYDGISRDPYASFVKCCDRIANWEYSLQSKSGMAKNTDRNMMTSIGIYTMLHIRKCGTGLTTFIINQYNLFNHGTY